MKSNMLFLRIQRKHGAGLLLKIYNACFTTHEQMCILCKTNYSCCSNYAKRIRLAANQDDVNVGDDTLAAINVGMNLTINYRRSRCFDLPNPLHMSYIKSEMNYEYIAQSGKEMKNSRN